ncbi:MAG: hypothetical protein A3E01_18810 [Gammaproteobacteria bacterium RIFCSPHIGHO2_12_FULL_63_22]|nr:MAG: hypothetical protein A3E01_18810 [Gammaproteobacteria bacterium RIFCSPHIGHO2_12_FULL_63_22]
MPIQSSAQDRFSRATFAERIADTIVSRADTAGLVLGLYGPWGDGKTSVLHMIEEHLNKRVDVVVTRFNPWQFTSEEQLLRGFFNTLASAIGARLTSRQEEIGEALKKYGKLLSIVSGGEAATTLGEALSTTTLDQLKARVEGFLADGNVRVVVLIDDIDRLDRAETHLIFKLVKLSAGFARTTYLLAFDDAVVAAALGERYGAGGDAAGRAFLEKIIQVPLHLPSAEPVALRALVFEGIDLALAQADIHLPRPQVDAFVLHFGSVEESLTTPRQAHLYANSLLFALPLVKGEVNIVEFMLIEALRLFHPKLHRVLRDNASLLLRARDQDREQRQKQIRDLIEEATPELTPERRQHLFSGLLSALFPRMSQMGYDSAWEAQWAREQRVCSSTYFHKFFAYGVSVSHISDRVIQGFLDALSDQTEEEQDAALRALATPEAVASLVQRLRQRESQVPGNAGPPLAKLFARNGALFPFERGALSSGGPRTQAAIVVYHLIKSVPFTPPRLDLATDALRHAQPVTFAVECLHWLAPSPNKAESEWVFDQADFDQLRELVVREVIVPADAQEPLYRQFGSECTTLYWRWQEVDATGVSLRLRACLDAGPEEIDIFLDAFVGEAWELGTGLSHRTDLDRGVYNELGRLVDPTDIARRLRERHGEQLDDPQFRQGKDVALGTRIAHQFAYLHVRALAEARERAAAAAPRRADEADDNRSSFA